MCCALDIIPLGRVNLAGSRTENLFRAIELSVPNVIAHLRVVHRDENNKVLDSREYNFDLNSGEVSSFIWRFGCISYSS